MAPFMLLISITIIIVAALIPRPKKAKIEHMVSRCFSCEAEVGYLGNPTRSFDAEREAGPFGQPEKVFSAAF